MLFATHPLRLTSREWFLCQHRLRDFEMFGFPRLQALIAEHGEEQSLGDFLLEELYTFVGEGWEQEDDITLLMLERSASLS